jgi:dolichyl-phosphate beta-glucosyltransferase
MPFVSMVIPAYNEGPRLGRFLFSLVEHGLAHPHPPVDFVVVDDGSVDGLRQCERDAVHDVGLRGGAHRFRLVEQHPNQGKGAAIRRGWRESDPAASWWGFVDADGAISASEVFRLVSTLAQTEAEVVFGSRIKMAGRHIERRLFRHLQGRVFATLVDRAFRLGVYDTQCGIKLIRTDLIRPLLNALEESRWMLDVELLVRARQVGGRLLEVPIDWADAGESKVRFGIDALTMLWTLRRMRRRLGPAERRG